jgi:hypothetical protein
MSLRALIAVALWAVVLFVLNLMPDPGIGSKGPPGPVFELERYFGWPAVYRAELWDSDDPRLAARGRGEFRLYDPTDEMNFRARYFGWSAVALDVAFAGIVLGTLVIAGRGDRRGRLERRWEKIGLVVCLVSLVVLYLLADEVAVSL